MTYKQEWQNTLKRIDVSVKQPDGRRPRRAKVAQRKEHSPPTNVAWAQILASTPVSWVEFDVGSPSYPERSFSAGTLVFRSP